MSDGPFRGHWRGNQRDDNVVAGKRRGRIAMIGRIDRVVLDPQMKSAAVAASDGGRDYGFREYECVTGARKRMLLPQTTQHVSRSIERGAGTWQRERSGDKRIDVVEEFRLGPGGRFDGVVHHGLSMPAVLGRGDPGSPSEDKAVRERRRHAMRTERASCGFPTDEQAFSARPAIAINEDAATGMVRSKSDRECARLEETIRQFPACGGRAKKCENWRNRLAQGGGFKEAE